MDKIVPSSRFQVPGQTWNAENVHTNGKLRPNFVKYHKGLKESRVLRDGEL
jgi:hypothetical protein